jgi:hypothetical protein
VEHQRCVGDDAEAFSAASTEEVTAIWLPLKNLDPEFNVTLQSIVTDHTKPNASMAVFKTTHAGSVVGFNTLYVQLVGDECTVVRIEHKP